MKLNEFVEENIFLVYLLIITRFLPRNTKRKDGGSFACCCCLVSTTSLSIDLSPSVNQNTKTIRANDCVSFEFLSSSSFDGVS